MRKRKKAKAKAKGPKIWKVISLNRRSVVLDPDSEFSLLYQVGKTTTSPEGTLGVFCFSSLNAARSFRDWKQSEGSMIITVVGIGKPTYPEKIVYNVKDDYNLRTFYNIDEDGKSLNLGDVRYRHKGAVRTCLSLNDTVCYPEVLVLE